MEKLDLEGIEIIVGTYEEFLLGYKLGGNEAGSLHKYKLEPSFTNHSHSGSIRAVAVVGKYLASGSADEAIRLINMGLRIEHGYMQQQTGSITCLANYGSKYLFSGCTDGSICIWKSGSWICEKTLNAHKGGVVDVSIHPSGKLALSVGLDKTLKTWNLIKGRTGFVTNLHGVGDCVRWSPEGSYYAVGILNRLDVYNVETAKVVYSVPFGKRVSCVCFANEDVVILGGDKDIVEVHNVKTSKKLSEFKAHTVRVKDIRFIEQHNILVTGSNCDQCVKLWRFSNKSCSKAPELLTEFDTTCRITCLTVWSKGISEHQSDIAKEEPEAEVAKDDDDEEEKKDEEKPVQPKKGKQQAKKKVKQLQVKMSDKKEKLLKNRNQKKNQSPTPSTKKNTKTESESTPTSTKAKTGKATKKNKSSPKAADVKSKTKKVVKPKIVKDNEPPKKKRKISSS